MKDKKITIVPKGISNKQYSIFLLELNIMKKAWKPYGVDVNISAPRFNKIVTWGNRTYETVKKNRRSSNHVEQNQRS
jgi:hypothetical protein